MRRGIFRLDNPPTDADVQAAAVVLEAFHFPWEWTVRRNVRETGQAVLPVGFRDRDGSWGYYDPGLNTVHVDPLATFTNPADFSRTLAHELGHLIDDTCLTHPTRREIHRLMHDGSNVPADGCPSEGYWRKGDRHSDRPSEAFANLAPHIWCPEFAKPIDRYGLHVFDRADDIKELVMGDAEQHQPFDDIAGTEHEDAILWAAREGIAFGDGGSFRPHEPPTRGQLMSFLRRALDERR